MLTAIVYEAALPLERGGRFAIWNWSIRRRSPIWLLAGAVSLISLLTMVPTIPPLLGRMYLGFAGIYVFSGLMWAWWVDGLHPADWGLGEVGAAFLATAKLAMANSTG